MVSDARAVLLAKRKRQMMAGGDARDRLGQMAKTTDARAKITKIRNIKQGKVGFTRETAMNMSNENRTHSLQLDVKKTAKGRITITTTTRGKTVLTTRKKEAAAGAVKRAFAAATGVATARPTVAPAAVRSRQIGSLTRRVGRGGQISLTTRDAGSALRPTVVAPRQVPAAARRSAPAARAPAARFLDRDEEVFRPREETFKPLTRTIKGTMSRAAQLDGTHHLKIFTTNGT